MSSSPSGATGKRPGGPGYGYSEKRYAQDFEPLAERYGVMGAPAECTERLEQFRSAGCNYFLLSAICDAQDERGQLETVAAEIVPSLRRR